MLPGAGSLVQGQNRSLLSEGSRPNRDQQGGCISPMQFELRHHGSGKRVQRPDLLLAQAFWARDVVENAKGPNG